MGSLVSLLVLGAIYSIVYVVKNLGSSTGDGKQVFGESFPEVEVLEPAPVPEFVAPAPEKTSKKRSSRAKQKRVWSGGTSGSVPQPHPQPQPQPRPVQPVAAEIPVPEKSEGEAAAKERLVRLHGKSEAKRAFIYSEIFNRKY